MIAPLEQCTNWLQAYFCKPWLTEQLPIPPFHHPVFQKGICNSTCRCLMLLSWLSNAWLTFHSGSTSLVSLKYVLQTSARCDVVSRGFSNLHLLQGLVLVLAQVVIILGLKCWNKAVQLLTSDGKKKKKTFQKWSDVIEGIKSLILFCITFFFPCFLFEAHLRPEHLN